MINNEYTHKMREGAEDFPLMVHLELTYVCNSKCLHCPYTPSNSDIRVSNLEKGNRHMPPELFKRIADEVGDFKRFLRITGGGEPMMHPNCVDLLLYAKKVGCSVGLITNGSLITPPVSDALLGAGVDVIEVSVDAADYETYRKIRIGLDWEHLMRNIDYMLERRNKEKLPTRIIVSVVHQKNNADLIEDIENFWKEKVDYVIIRKFLSWGIVNRGLAGDNTPFLEQETPCPYPYERTVVTLEGEVVLCGYDVRSEQAFGDVRKQSISEIWNSHAYKGLREKMWLKDFNAIPFCRDCQDRIFRSWDHNYLKTLKESQERLNIKAEIPV